MTKSHVLCEVKALEGGSDNGEFEAILSAPTLDRDGEVVDGKAFEPLPEHIPIDIDHGMTVATTVGSGVPFYDGDVLKIKGTFSSIPRAQELRTLVAEGHIRKMSVTFMGAERSEKDSVPHVTKAELLNAAFVPIPSNREATVLVAKAFRADAAKAAVNDTDAEFLRAMIVHHEAAVEMATGYLADDGEDARVQELAQAIVEAQTAEIASMREWLTEAPAGGGDMPGMRSGAKAGARNSVKDAENLQIIHDLAVTNGAACSGKSARATDATAPETPAAAGKSPASVVTQARMIAARALLDL